MNDSLLRTSRSRLWESLMEMARIGATQDGGCRRLALTEEDKAGRELFVSWAVREGCSIAVDLVGNVFAERPGADTSRPAVIVGSHLDTQPTGGRFDGAYGVLAALEIIRALNEHDVRTAASVIAVSWTNEEGARFPQPTTGSGVFSGSLTLAEALGQTAIDGATFGDELDRLGLAGKDAVANRAFAAYFETHIEQGPLLESGDHTIGAVTGAQGLRGLEVTIVGREAHAGTTPMTGRRDALLGAAQIVMAVHELPARIAGSLATVSKLAVEPGSRSVIPGRVTMVIDIRHPQLEELDRLEREVRGSVSEIAARSGFDVSLNTFLRNDPVTFDESCVEAIRNAAERLDIRYIEMISGAGHDAVAIARAVPAAMIFVPCKDGVSHNPAEYASPADLQAGCDVLLHAVLDKAGVVEAPPARGD